MFQRLKRVTTRRAASAVGVPGIHARLDRLEAKGISVGLVRQEIQRIQELLELNLFAAELRTKDYIEVRLTELEKLLQQQVDEIPALIETRIEDLATASSGFTRLVQEETMQAVSELLSGVRRQIDHVRITKEVNTQIQLTDFSPPPSSVSQALPDELYEAFEDQYRGREEDIKNRQSYYLPIVQSVVNVNNPLLDIGCGRGEWLTLLRDHGLPASGVDTNQAAVARCTERGLQVDLDDGLRRLRSVPESSLGAVTLFQVIEHLDLATLVEVLRSSLTALTTGGVLLAEFPNIESLSVGASTFWLDPTHIRPLHPQLVTFLAREVGFRTVNLEYPDASESESNDRRTSCPDVALRAVK